MNRTFIVVPCYNEEARLDTDAFAQCIEEQPNTSFILVNDGSRRIFHFVSTNDDGGQVSHESVLPSATRSLFPRTTDPTKPSTSGCAPLGPKRYYASPVSSAPNALTGDADVTDVLRDADRAPGRLPLVGAVELDVELDDVVALTGRLNAGLLQGGLPVDPY